MTDCRFSKVTKRNLTGTAFPVVMLERRDKHLILTSRNTSGHKQMSPSLLRFPDGYIHSGTKEKEKKTTEPTWHYFFKENQLFLSWQLYSIFKGYGAATAISWQGEVAVIVSGIQCWPSEIPAYCQKTIRSQLSIKLQCAHFYALFCVQI